MAHQDFHSRGMPTDAIKAAARAAAALLVTLALFLPQAVVRAATRGPASFVLPRLWHRALCALLGIDVVQVGEVDTRPGMVYVGNHISHFDIFVMGACAGAAFIAKGEMAGWPGMRLLGSMQHTLFVSRKARDAVDVATRVAASRRLGHRLVLFAEGTTSRGDSVAAFKSSLFSVLIDAAQAADVDAAAGTVDATEPRGSGTADTSSTRARERPPAHLQPFTLRLLGTDGIAAPEGFDPDLYAFHGGMKAGAHVWRFLRSRGARVEVVLHPPIEVVPGMTRKSLAIAAHTVVASGLGTR